MRAWMASAAAAALTGLIGAPALADEAECLHEVAATKAHAAAVQDLHQNYGSIVNEGDGFAEWMGQGGDLGALTRALDTDAFAFNAKAAGAQADVIAACADASGDDTSVTLVAADEGGEDIAAEAPLPPRAPNAAARVSVKSGAGWSWTADHSARGLVVEAE